MNLVLESLKLVLELGIIVIVSKNLLVPTLRKLGKSLNLKPNVIGNIAGIATSIPELLTVIFSSINGMTEAGMFNILSSNVINMIQYILSIIINKNTKYLKNKAIIINLILTVLTIIIPIIIIIYKTETNIVLVPIFIVLFYIFNKINNISHSKFSEKDEKTESKYNARDIIVYTACILVIGGILYLVGNYLGSTLEILCKTFNISEVLIGFILGIATSIPELITFIESQKYHKDKDSFALTEASNNLLVSNTLNLFIIQSISIIIIQFL